MADATVNIKVKLDNADSAKSIGDTRKAIKDLKSAALEVGEAGAGFDALTKKAAELEDKLGDLNDVTKIQGTGIEKLKTSMGLLTEGFKNADPGKLSVAMKGLGSAMRTIPLLAIIEGITYLIENFDELSKGSGILGKVLRTVGDIIQWVVDKMYEFTDAIGLTNSALDKQGEALVTNAEKAKVALEQQTKEYDNQIAAAKAAGKSSVQLEIDKQVAIINTNKALVEQTIAYVRAGGILNDEQKKLLTEQINGIKDASAQINIIKLTAEKQANDKANELAKERKKEVDKDFEDYKKKYKEFDDYRRKLADDLQAYLKQQDDEARKTLEAGIEKDTELVALPYKSKETLRKEDAKKEQEALNQSLAGIQSYANAIAATLNAVVGVFSAIAELQQQQRNQQLLEQQRATDASLEVLNQQRDAELAKEGLTAEQKAEIANTYAQKEYQLKLAQYNRETEVKKKAFEQDKKLKIATTIISTITGSLAALVGMIQAIPGPIGIILGAVAAVAVGVTGAIQVAKIKQQKFDAGSPPSPPNISAPSTSGIDSQNGPETRTSPSELQDVGSKAGGNNPNQQPVQKVYVVSQEVEQSNDKAKMIEERSKF